MSKERKTRSVRYTATNFVVGIVVTLVVEFVEGLVVVVVLVVEAVLLVDETVVALVVEANDFVDVLVVLPVAVLKVVEEGVNEVKTEVVVFGPVIIAALVIFVMRAENAVVGLVVILAVLRVLFSKAVEEGVAEVKFKTVDVDVPTRVVVTTVVSVVGAVEVVTIVNSGIRICISV